MVDKLTLLKSRRDKKRSDSAWIGPFQESQLPPQTQFTCVLLLQGSLAVTGGKLLAGAGAQRTRSCPPSGAARKNSRNVAEAAGCSRDGSGDWLAGRATSKHKGSSRKGEPWPTEKTESPVFVEIYTFPSEIGWGWGSHAGSRSGG